MNGQKKTVGLAKGGRPTKTGGTNPPHSKPTLAEAGIDKDLAKKARRLLNLGFRDCRLRLWRGHNG
jgi:hypothetical protein